MAETIAITTQDLEPAVRLRDALGAEGFRVELLTAGEKLTEARDPVLLAAVAAGSRALQGAFATAQEAGELTRAFSATALATLFEGMLLRLCIGYCAGPPPERPLESAVAEALAFFMRAARV